MPANVCCSSVELREYGTTNDWGACHSKLVFVQKQPAVLIGDYHGRTPIGESHRCRIHPIALAARLDQRRRSRGQLEGYERQRLRGGIHRYRAMCERRSACARSARVHAVWTVRGPGVRD